MKPPLCFFIIMLLGLAAVAQAPDAPAPRSASTNSVAPHPDPPTFDSAALTTDLRFVLPPDTPGESSSSTHFDSDKASVNVPAIPADVAAAAPFVPDTPCDKPAEVFSARDYSGPLNRFTAWFSRKPELTTVPKLRKSGQRICRLTVGEKFHLFTETTIDPLTFIGAGVSAGISQYNHDDKEFGLGAEGYGKRYGAAFADVASWNFFGKFFYPAIFRQDPRYYRQGQGSTSGRLGRALAHTFVARGDHGHSLPNFSLWAGTATTVALSNLYHPGNDRGFGPAAQRAGIGIGTSMGFDVLKEFWPEIVRKLHLPFKERHVTPVGTIANR